MVGGADLGEGLQEVGWPASPPVGVEGAIRVMANWGRGCGPMGGWGPLGTGPARGRGRATP